MSGPPPSGLPAELTIPCPSCAGSGRQFLPPPYGRVLRATGPEPRGTREIAEIAEVSDELARYYLRELEHNNLVKKAGRMKGTRGVLWVRAEQGDGAAPAAPGGDHGR